MATCVTQCCRQASSERDRAGRRRKEHSDMRRTLRKECREMKFGFTCGLFKHATDAAHSPVLGQGLGRHLALHPALLRLAQRFVQARFPGLCRRSPVRGGLVVSSSIVQDLRLKTRDNGSEPWMCFPSSPEVTHLLQPPQWVSLLPANILTQCFSFPTSRSWKSS